MKRTILLISLFALIFMAFSAFTPHKKAVAPDSIMKDFKYSVFNAELEARFEKQFADIVADVTHIDVHQTKAGDYYYTVYGNNSVGSAVVDYFKTTKQEVESESYNYIEMTARTMGGRKKCREAYPFPIAFCHPTNSGWICGIEQWPNGPCFLY